MPVAVPNAWMPRPATSQPRSGAARLTSVPATMMPRPASTAARRPNRSATGPQASTPKAKLTSEMENVAWTAATLAPKCSRTDGSAGR